MFVNHHYFILIFICHWLYFFHYNPPPFLFFSLLQNIHKYALHLEFRELKISSSPLFIYEVFYFSFPYVLKEVHPQISIIYSNIFRSQTKGKTVFKLAHVLCHSLIRFLESSVDTVVQFFPPLINPPPM